MKETNDFVKLCTSQGAVGRTNEAQISFVTKLNWFDKLKQIPKEVVSTIVSYFLFARFRTVEHIPTIKDVINRKLT